MLESFKFNVHVVLHHRYCIRLQYVITYRC